MPYIEKRLRAKYDEVLDALPKGFTGETSAGELAYLLTEISTRWVGESRFGGFALVLGVLEAVKLEFYRRKVAPYEDQKKVINGDAY